MATAEAPIRDVADLPALCDAGDIQQLVGCSRAQAFAYLHEMKPIRLSPRVLRVRREDLLRWLEQKAEGGER